MTHKACVSKTSREHLNECFVSLRRPCHSRVCRWSDGCVVCVCSLIQRNSLLQGWKKKQNTTKQLDQDHLFFIRLVGKESNNFIFPSLRWGRPPFFNFQSRRFGCTFVFQATTGCFFLRSLQENKTASEVNPTSRTINCVLHVCRCRCF